MGTIAIGQPGSIIAHLNTTRVLLNRYKVVHSDGTPVKLPDGNQTEFVRSLGSGSFGVVVRAEDELGIPRAIKFFKPREFSFSGETSTYKHEIGLTNATPFKNVIRIMDHGEDRDANGRSYGMYVMDFVHGVSLTHFFTHSILTNRENILKERSKKEYIYALTFSILDQLVEATRELHEVGVAHMDIKPQNVLVLTGYTSSDTPKPAETAAYKLWLTDLGAGKKIRRERKGRTKLIWTERYFPEHLLDDLDFDPNDGSVSYEKLWLKWPQIDLHCIGRSLEQLFLDVHSRLQNTHLAKFLPNEETSEEWEKEKETFWKSLLGAEFEVLKRIIDDLVNPRSPIVDISALQQLFAKIARNTPANVRSSELLTDPYPGIQIKVGDELVNVSSSLKAIVDHPAFQRLKTLSQLALISETFPGATHTRFSHSLLTFNLAKQFVFALSRDSFFRYLFKRHDIDTVLCGALLHDLGQYPFAHSLEDLRKAADCYKEDDHLGHQIKYDQELLGRMASLTDGRGKSIANFLADIGIQVPEIETLVSKELARDLPTGRSHPMMIGREIINGTIDVDRISYLRYDSLMTGVPYGRGIDMDGLLRNLVVRYEPPIAVGLAVNEEGVNAAEMILAAVYWMYRNVYWHRTNRLTMAVLKHVFYKLLQEGATSFDRYIEETAFSGDRGALSLLEEKWRHAYGDLDNPLGALLSGQRLRYHAVIEFGNRGAQETLWEKLVFNGTRKNIEDLTQRVSDVLGYRRRGDNDPGILWDIPLKPRLPTALTDNVQALWATRAEAGSGVRLWVKMRGASTYGLQWSHITEYSALAAAVTKEEDRQGRRIRLFLSDKIFDESPFGRQSKGRSALEKEVLKILQDASTGWPSPT